MPAPAVASTAAHIKKALSHFRFLIFDFQSAIGNRKLISRLRFLSNHDIESSRVSFFYKQT
jgi:hypothetical protein